MYRITREAWHPRSHVLVKSYEDKVKDALIAIEEGNRLRLLLKDRRVLVQGEVKPSYQHSTTQP